jgi:hypothetical protein
MNVPEQHAGSYGALGEPVANQFDGMEPEWLEALPRTWHYDENYVVRDVEGRVVDTAAWTRAWTVATSTQELAGPITQPDPYQAVKEATRLVDNPDLDRLGNVAYQTFLSNTGDYVGNYGYTSTSNRMPLLWRSVVSAVLKTMGPVEAAFVAIGEGLGKERERTNVERARAYQLATMFEDVLGRYRAVLVEKHGGTLPEDLQDLMDDYTLQFEESCCEGCNHDENQPHVDFRRTT